MGIRGSLRSSFVDRFYAYAKGDAVSSISIAKGRDKPRCRRAPAIVGKKHDIGVVTYEISSGFEASAELRRIDRRRGGIIRVFGRMSSQPIEHKR